MAKYKIESLPTTHTWEIEADAFQSVGEFVDFFEGGLGPSDVVFRLRADQILSVELVKE